jgi:hypothetical protein
MHIHVHKCKNDKIKKNNQEQKWAGGVAQAVVLLCKCEALSLNPSSTKRKKKSAMKKSK